MNNASEFIDATPSAALLIESIRDIGYTIETAISDLIDNSISAKANNIYIKLNDDDKIIDVKFKTYGCGSAIASSTMFVEMLKGKTLEEAKLIKDKEIADALELPPIKLHCSVLAEETIKHAIEDWEKKTQRRKHNNPPE